MKEFNSFGAFSKHLLKTATYHGEVTKHLAKTGAEMIEKEAKSRIGYRQEGWADLAESTKKDKERTGYAFNADFNPLMRTGELYASYGSSVERGTAVAGSTSDVALYQELGSMKTPPREVLRPSAMAQQKKINALIGNGLIAWLSATGFKRPKKLVGK